MTISDNLLCNQILTNGLPKSQIKSASASKAIQQTRNISKNQIQIFPQ